MADAIAQLGKRKQPGVIVDFLYDRLNQLQDRKMMIPRYVQRSGAFAGKKKDFSMNDLPKIGDEIEETKVAIKAIEDWRKNKKKK